MLPLLRSMRPQQWVKNLFLLLPLVFAEGLSNENWIVLALGAFAVFCALSSAVYLLNDLVDREKDRQHPLKRMRPLASGALRPATARAAMFILLVPALAGAWVIGTSFFALSLLYLAQNVAYSYWLKRIVIVDILVVAFGFVIRVLAGAAAISVEVSHWLLLCTIFLALFLAASKRRHELQLLSRDAAAQREVLEQYSATFLDQLINVVTASTLLSYALYTTAPGTIERFGTPHLVYTIAFVLFGILRYLFLIYQKQGLRNPTEAMLRDPPFVANLILWGIVVVTMLYWP